jgi:hypothetical protein
MAVRPLPVRAQSREVEGEDARGEIRTIDSRQNREAAVVGDQREPASALARAPADPSVAILEVIGRRTPAQQRQPFPLKHGHVTAPFAHQLAVMQVMMSLHQCVIARQLRFILPYQNDLDAIQDRLP